MSILDNYTGNITETEHYLIERMLQLSEANKKLYRDARRYSLARTSDGLMSELGAATPEDVDRMLDEKHGDENYVRSLK